MALLSRTWKSEWYHYPEDALSAAHHEIVEARAKGWRVIETNINTVPEFAGPEKETTPIPRWRTIVGFWKDEHEA